MHSIPALFIFSLGTNATISFKSCIPVEGNILDVVFIESQGSFLYSMDVVHAPLSKVAIQADRERKLCKAVGLLEVETLGHDNCSGRNKQLIENMEECIDSQSDIPQDGTAKGKSMKELLYNLESLRKRDPED